MMNRHERRRTRKARENKFYTGYVKQTVPGSDTPAAREWDLRLKRIRADSLALCKRLLPGITWSDDKYEWLGQWYADAASPPKSWSRWARPEGHEPIDDAVAKLRDKKQMRDKASLTEAGISCPFWYARAGVVTAFETAHLTAAAAEVRRRNYQAECADLDWAIDNGPRIIDAFNRFGKMQGPLGDAVQLNPQSLHSSAMFRADDLFDRYVRARNELCDQAESLEPFVKALDEVLKIAHEARKGICNNPPQIFERSFAEATWHTFADLTGAASPVWGPVFHEYSTAAWDSAGLSPELSGEKLLRKLRKLDAR
jgi:hypothetical protein